MKPRSWIGLDQLEAKRESMTPDDEENEKSIKEKMEITKVSESWKSKF